MPIRSGSFTSESVLEGQPDWLADRIVDGRGDDAAVIQGVEG
jgi:S-adenosylmethionine synthetase